MFHTFFYEPIYNLLAFLLEVVPLHDIGAAIILVTCIVKGLLLPLNLSALRGQYAMKKVEKEIATLRERYKDNAPELSRAMMEVYKREKINPFASILVIIIQMPILFALYYVMLRGLHADPESLYSFITFPETLHTLAFGFLDVTQKSLWVAVLTGVSSYALAHRQTQSMISTKQAHEETFQDHFMKSMRVQMLYVLPIVIGVSAFVLPAALGLYWITGNVIGVFQDMYIKRKVHEQHTGKKH